MAVVHYVTSQAMLPNGEVLLRGKLTIGTTAAGGATLNLANYFHDEHAPTLLLGIATNATNVAFPLFANVINAETITILALAGGLGASEPFYLLNAGLELTAQNVDFHAFGRADLG